MTFKETRPLVRAGRFTYAMPRTREERMVIATAMNGGVVPPTVPKGSMNMRVRRSPGRVTTTAAGGMDLELAKARLWAIKSRGKR
jgi:hypothetical protein